MAKIFLQSKVVMVGPTGVGKTSLLIAMSEQLQDTLQKLGYVASIPPQIKIKAFQEMAEAKGILIPPKLQLANSQRLDQHEVTVRHQDADFIDMSITFVDVPGRWYIPTDTNHREVKEHLESTDVSFWCVDSVSMMEADGRYHAEYNAPSLIDSLYKETPLQVGHKIIFVLMRSETYVQEGRDRDIAELYRVFNEKYNQSITAIKNIQSSRKVEFYCCHVETLGNVVFNHFESDGKAEFKRLPAREYSPKNCDTPALFPIKRAIERACEKAVAKKSRIISWIPFVNKMLGWEYEVAPDVARRMKTFDAEIQTKIDARGDDDKKLRMV